MRWGYGLRKKWAPRKQLKSALLALLEIKTVPSTTTLPDVTDLWVRATAVRGTYESVKRYY